MDREEVFKLIDGERRYQLNKWGRQENEFTGPVEPWHEVAAWLTFMQDYLTEAIHLASRSTNQVPVLENIRKITSMGVACMEQHGATARQ